MKKLFCALVAALILGLALLVPTFSRDIRAGSVASIREAVLRAAAQCYAVEGVYPSSLEYLEENYGLVLNHDRYYIIYDSFSSNLPPTVEVLEKG